MVPEDDARSTVELDDRFVILPSHSPGRMQAYLDSGGIRLPEGFSYCSNINEEQLGPEELRKILAGPQGT